MKKIILAISLVLAFAANAQGIRWLQTDHDFGAFSEDLEKVTAYFRFVNDTDQDVMISSVASTCGCTVPAYSKDAIAPGDTAQIEVTYNAIGRPGRFSKYVHVRTTADNERTKLLIKGTVIGNERSVKTNYPVDLGALKLRTGAAMLGKVSPGHGKAIYLDGYNQSNDSLRIRFDNVPPYLQVGTVPNVVPPGDLVSINFYFRGDKCKDWGLVTDSIMVSTSASAVPAVLPVIAIIEEDFSNLTPEEKAASPSLSLVGDRIDLGRVAVNSTAKVTARIQVLNRGENPLKIRRVYSQDPSIEVKASKTEVKKGKTADITVKYDPSGNPSDPINTRITLITNDPASPTRTIRVVGDRK